MDLTITDGKELFQKECVVISMIRCDHWWEWAGISHTNIVLPFKGPSQFDIITDTEVGLMMKLKGDVVQVHGLWGYTFAFVEIPVGEFRRFAKEQFGMQEAKA